MSRGTSSFTGVVAVVAVIVAAAGCSGSTDDDVNNSAGGALPPESSTTASTTVSTPTSNEEMPLLPRVNSEADEDTEIGLIGSTHTISGDGYTIRVQVSDPATVRRSSTSTVSVLVPVSIDVVDGAYDLNPSHWVLRTLSGQEIDGITNSSAPTAIGKATVTGHIEGVIPFVDYSTRGALTNDEVSLSLVQLVPAGTAGVPVGQWNWPEPVPITELPAAQ
ncbi:hypothetical protein VX037_22920 [Gordonia sp. Z-3]|uniref:Uncharacterized protein n=1 Tax=Gordonia tangerina TaxID=2911060 RepID=A0ABS9DJQ9_9ACTN|nr:MULTISPECIES: hypothetical protein [Gordonia]MCF3938534.1 hypothetical protein [Gordonia tangerina]MED5803883.1 hypothetical protein [Gordonia sp. Z-3]